MCVLCVFIDLLRSPSLRRDGVDMALIVPVAAPAILSLLSLGDLFLYVCFMALIVPVAAPAILSFSMCVSCVCRKENMFCSV